MPKRPPHDCALAWRPCARPSAAPARSLAGRPHRNRRSACCWRAHRADLGWSFSLAADPLVLAPGRQAAKLIDRRSSFEVVSPSPDRNRKRNCRQCRMTQCWSDFADPADSSASGLAEFARNSCISGWKTCRMDHSSVCWSFDRPDASQRRTHLSHNILAVCLLRQRSGRPNWSHGRWSATRRWSGRWFEWTVRPGRGEQRNWPDADSATDDRLWQLAVLRHLKKLEISWNPAENAFMFFVNKWRKVLHRSGSISGCFIGLFYQAYRVIAAEKTPRLIIVGCALSISWPVWQKACALFLERYVIIHSWIAAGSKVGTKFYILLGREIGCLKSKPWNMFFKLIALIERVPKLIRS